MSNTEEHPAELLGECGSCPVDDAGHPVVEVLSAREVPLGGPRAMAVRRTLPQRQRSMVGAWCFADHYGPDDVSVTGGMMVPPHPHTGLQTVSWLFSGEIEHRDSGGVHAVVRPGELNLMTGGRGICHSEVSTPATTILHGAQLWVALPDAARDAPRDFQHYVPPAVEVDGAWVRVFLGALAGQVSPVRTFTPLVGAEITVGPGARVELAVVPDFEHGLLADSAELLLGDTALARGELGYVGTGASTLAVHNPTGTAGRALLLGGAPFDEEIVMWWNFVGRSHDEIVAFRADWQRETERFGRVDGYRAGSSGIERLPAPVLPPVRIRPRGNRSQ
ncbi:pirin family protein [Mycobacterium sp. M1]|uniref:Pirin family protein n=1 Tax=Mycolicibacter acidiphilus TaxID=2835306 RepID=A0ABS5RI77_9MYCO|nr:pirin family protein [Mycolicibacter acidiphilus]MBS9533304.1 pirin family protein [Mycolicibacter acidiphilus]